MQAPYERRYVTTHTHDFEKASATRELASTTSNTYRSSMAPRVTNVQRSRPSALGNNGVMTRIFQSFQSTGGGSNFGPGLAALASFPGVPIRGSGGTQTALVGVNATRQRDKRDLVQLNDKFAQYVEKVRFLEAQNRKLQLELDALRSRSGQGSSRIKEMYDIEMNEAGKLIDDTKRAAASSHVKALKSEQDANNQRARYSETAGFRDTDRKEVDIIQRKLAENEAQINLFRRRICDLEDEARRFKGESQRLAAEIARIQRDIQNEMFLKTSLDVEKFALEDEIASLKHMHEGDLAELRARTVSTDLDPSQFFRNELAQAIREIRSDYENILENQRSDLQNRYSIVFNEFVLRQRPDASLMYNEQQRRQQERVSKDVTDIRTQNSHMRARNEEMRNRIVDIQRKLSSIREDGSLAQAKGAKELEEARRRLERVTRDLEEVSNMKTSLEKEISTYRNLLENQNGLRGCVDRIVHNAEQQAIERPSIPHKGGTTSITHTSYSATGSNYGYGGVGSLVAQSTRPISTYQTIPSGARSTVRGSSDNLTRQSTDY